MVHRTFRADLHEVLVQREELPGVIAAEWKLIENFDCFILAERDDMLPGNVIRLVYADDGVRHYGSMPVEREVAAGGNIQFAIKGGLNLPCNTGILGSRGLHLARNLQHPPNDDHVFVRKTIAFYQFVDRRIVQVSNPRESIVTLHRVSELPVFAWLAAFLCRWRRSSKPDEAGYLDTEINRRGWRGTRRQRGGQRRRGRLECWRRLQRPRWGQRGQRRTRRDGIRGGKRNGSLGIGRRCANVGVLRRCVRKTASQRKHGDDQHERNDKSG